jgi:flagellar hook-basal body complex protein FliE
MAIIPMSSIVGQNKIGSTSKITENNAVSIDESKGSGFQEMLQGLISNVEETEAQTKVDAYNLSIGNMDDTHTMMINSAKAEIALQTMVQIRNKVMESYSTIINTNL